MRILPEFIASQASVFVQLETHALFRPSVVFGQSLGLVIVCFVDTFVYRYTVCPTYVSMPCVQFPFLGILDSYYKKWSVNDWNV